MSERQSPQVLCFGRAGVDLYAVEEGVPFAEVRTLRKSFGGSPANIAVGLSRLGISAGMVGKVSDDMLGESVRGYLQSEGVDTTLLLTDRSGGRTSLAVTETRPDDCRVVIYRNKASDMLIEPNELDRGFIAGAKALLISGQALSAEPSCSTMLRAVEIAREHGRIVFTDLDYRPYSWANPLETAEVYQHIARQSTYLIGNTEEFACFSALPGFETVEKTISWCHAQGVRGVVLKQGRDGSLTYLAGQEPIRQPAFNVKAKKPFGAGDAFAASLICGVLESLSFSESLRNGAAAAAIVVSRFGCAESMPDKKEIEQFLQDRIN